ncbi:MAG: response regulator [Phycisphaeraceae bacterium]|nr:response regulator [Phycisphaeraceae bacterium]
MAIAKHILVVDDERDLVELLVYNLKRAGYDVSTAFNGRQALDCIFNRVPDLIILDVMLPELSGTEVASRVRGNPQTASVPIVMLTAKGEEVDQIVGLTVGADDYIPKPFSMKVLIARVEAVLRRANRQTSGSGILQINGLEINPDTHEAFVHGESIKLTLTEFRLLATLVAGNGRVFSRLSLMTRAMGAGVTVTERTIDVHMTALRKKLGPCAGLIKTVRGVGYKVSADASTEDELSGVV